MRVYMGKAVTVKSSMTSNKLILPHQPNHDDFLQIMNKVFLYSSLFGVMGSRRPLVKIWSLLIFAGLLLVVIFSMWKVIRALGGWARDTTGHRSVTARMSGTIFYSISTLSLILCSKLAMSWRELSTFWAAVEKSAVIQAPSDKTLKKRMLIFIGFMFSFCVFEHWTSVISLVGLDCPRRLILQRYILKSHGFLLMWSDYTDFTAVPLMFISSIATALWAFQDLMIVLISMGLTSRYHRLNQCLANISVLEKKQIKWNEKTDALKVYTWRRIREAYVKQAALVRKVDSYIGGLVLLSCSCNFYFICLQLFLGITTGRSIALARKVYFVVSLAWLCIRVSSVVLAASDVTVQSKKSLNYIYDCDPHCYNVEMDRLQNQLVKDYVALSGMGFFYLSRMILLQMAGAIITYELVLIQFDGGDSTSDANSTVFNVSRN